MSDNLTKTRSYTYLLPGLAAKINLDKVKIKNLFLGIENKTKEFNGNVYILVDKDTELDKSNYWIQDHTVGDDLLIEYEYPDIDVYIKFIRGKYSELERSYKETILKYHNLNATHKVSHILYKNKILKDELENLFEVVIDGELGDIIEYNEECYKC
jgi:hypothetical protein